MKVLLHEMFSYGHSQHSLRLLLTSTRFKALTQNPDLHITLLVSERLADVLRAELAAQAQNVETRTFPTLENSSSWRVRWQGGQKLREELRRSRYDRLIVLSGDLLGVFAPWIHAASPRTEAWYQVYRCMFAYREAGYPMAGYNGRRFWGPWLKNLVTLLYRKLGFLKGFLLEDEGAMRWCDRRGIPCMRIFTPGLGEQFPPRVPAPRIRFTLFGVLSAAKHVPEVLEAWGLLPEELRKGATLRICGKIMDRDREAIQTAYERVRDESIHMEDRFLEDTEITDLLSRSDVLINLYTPEHVGCSAVLVQAALLGVPVIVTHRGWVGHVTRRFGLGVALEESRPAAIAETLTTAIRDSVPFDAQGAETFSTPYRGEAYARSLCRALLGGRDD
jgi:glycosyltransferase involved in cell wall biosynthesis